MLNTKCGGGEQSPDLSRKIERDSARRVCRSLRTAEVKIVSLPAIPGAVMSLLFTTLRTAKMEFRNF